MINFKRYQLKNGLRVIIHEDNSTPMVAVNMLYNVGARDESPSKTGFAHLFEHLMFGGTKTVPNYDEPIQSAGGDCNAFTNNDITNFYQILPAVNVETAFWLEADRMINLNITEKPLETQRKVVLEEFKETTINEPYGDVWHHLTDMAYKVHPYRWPTIGKVPSHVEEATLKDVRDFYHRFYQPNNAILVVSGNVNACEINSLIEKWFAEIPSGSSNKRILPQEPPQEKLEQRVKKGNVPVDALYMAFHAPGRLENEYFATDLLSDVLCNGQSSRLYRRLLKEQRIVNAIDCYITGSIDPGLLIIEAKPAKNVSLRKVEEAIWQEIEQLKLEKIEARELQKLKNKMESSLLFSEMNILNKAINLAFFELIDNVDMINQEAAAYQKINVQEIQDVACKLLTKENCSTLYYEVDGSH